MKLRERYKLKLIGKELDNYIIEDRIWQGATSTVYKVRDSFSPSEVFAMKILHLYRMEPIYKKQFSKEGKLLIKLNHPNIIKVYKLKKADEFLYMLMEYINGKSLKQLLMETEIPIEKLIYIFWEVSKGIEYIHRKRIIHKDIKPENILVSYNFEKIKLIDFGYAKKIRWLKKVFAEGGTEKYMPPEQKVGFVDKRSDIYSLGVVMKEILLKKTNDETITKIAWKASEESISKRYQNMAELMNDFKPVVEKLG